MPETQSGNLIANARFEVKHAKLYTEQLIREIEKAGVPTKENLLKQLEIIRICSVDGLQQLLEWTEINPYKGDLD